MDTVERKGEARAGRPYVPVVRAGNWVYTSGYTGFYQDGTVPEDFREQFGLVVEKAKRNLASVGATLSEVVHVTVYLTDDADYEELNVLFADVFGTAPPTRACVRVAGLSSPDKRIEMQFVAFTAEGERGA